MCATFKDDPVRYSQQQLAHGVKLVHGVDAPGELLPLPGARPPHAVDAASLPGAFGARATVADGGSLMP